MGRTTADGPRGVRPAPPPAPPARIINLAPPDNRDAITKAYIDGQAAPRRVACSYCGRGGLELTQCEGCGAPVPEASSRPRPAFPANRVIREGAWPPPRPPASRDTGREIGGFDALDRKLEELEISGRVLLARLLPARPDRIER